jgi:hypothetical protein
VSSDPADEDGIAMTMRKNRPAAVGRRGVALALIFLASSASGAADGTPEFKGKIH